MSIPSFAPQPARRVWTLYEHERTSGFHLTDQERRGLARIAAAPRNGSPPLVEEVGNEVRAAQHVGVVLLPGGRVVQILPKMHAEESDTTDAILLSDRAREATTNLLHLLQQTGRLPIRDGEITSLLRRRETHWFDTLSRLYEKRLREAWAAAAPRRYEQREDDDSPMLRGKWRLTEQARRPERPHLFAVTYDELTADAPLARVLRYVAETLSRFAGDPELRGKLQELGSLLRIDDVSLCPSLDAARSDARMARSQMTRLYAARFGPLLDLASLLLEGASVQLTSAPTASGRESLATWSLTFDMNALFESFVFRALSRNADHCLPEPLAGFDLLAQTQGAQLYLAQRVYGGSADNAPTNSAATVKEIFRLKPDVAVRNPANGQIPLLIDTKYKRLTLADRRLGVAPADLYQMYAYAHRYDCRRILLMYPQTAGMTEPVRARFLFDDADRSVAIATIDLTRPLGTASAQQALIDSLRDALDFAFTDQ